MRKTKKTDDLYLIIIAINQTANIKRYFVPINWLAECFLEFVRGCQAIELEAEDSWNPLMSVGDKDLTKLARLEARHKRCSFN